MLGIKRLYLYTLQKFFPLLAMNFLIAWFIVVMRALWSIVEDVVGKGIDGFLLFELIFYAAVSVVPQALFLAVLLASLMTFGSLGEKLELLAIKTAGIPLYRVMQPVFVVVVLLSIGSYVFQNDWLIKSQVKFYTLYFSASNKAPELEIPEGSFYSRIPRMSIYVKKKDVAKKMLRDVIIYDFSQGHRDARIILADSARLFSYAETNKLVMRLYSGESFENLREQASDPHGELVPYRRETFEQKDLVSAYDASFSLMDQDIISSQFVGKNIQQLAHYTDSMKIVVDSLQADVATQMLNRSYLKSFSSERTVYTPSKVFDTSLKAAPEEPSAAETLSPSHLQTLIDNGIDPNDIEISSEDGVYISEDSVADGTKETTWQEMPDLSGTDEKKSTLTKELEAAPKIVLATPENRYAQLSDIEKERVNYYKKMADAGLEQRLAIISQTRETLENNRQSLAFDQTIVEDQSRVYRRNLIEWHKKLTIPIACIVFFFIGAPLGAIIRKGGLGTPSIIAVLFFIFYFIMDSIGYRMTRDGKWMVWFGLWLPTMVLIPIGVWLSYIATKDSSKLNVDAYILFVKRLFGSATARKVEFKEVTMVDVESSKAVAEIDDLLLLVKNEQEASLLGYKALFLDKNAQKRRQHLVFKTERMVEYLGNSRNLLLVSKLAEVPILSTIALLPQSGFGWFNKILMILFPLGMVVYGYYYLRTRQLRKSLAQMQETLTALRVYAVKEV
ncbi:MAG: LptF/LptG family permease [Porphyromonas sp.]|nr:LptF/LptG family permease [Porphyromonas sp.]